MGESQAIGVRLEKDFLKKIERLGREEHLDRSTAMRILLEEGYENHMKKRAMQDYLSEKTTISGAAEKAGLSVWEMEKYLVSHGFKSQYSVPDLKEELDLLKGRKK